MSDNKNENVVVAIFGSQSEADAAIDGLKDWDQASDDIKLGAIGTIVKDGDKVKTHVGHKTGRGAVVGAVVGVIAGVLSGGLTLLGGLLGGGALGGAGGAFMKQSLHLTKQEIDALGNELDAGKVAVVVTCDEAEIEPTKTQLETYGGTTRTYGVPQAALAEATQAMAVAEGAAVPAVAESETDATVAQGEPVPATPEASVVSEGSSTGESATSEPAANTTGPTTTEGRTPSEPPAA
jgi:hypothetical protein